MKHIYPQNFKDFSRKNINDIYHIKSIIFIVTSVCNNKFDEKFYLTNDKTPK